MLWPLTMVKGKILITTWIVVTNPNITNINANYFYNDKIYALYGILDKNIGKFKVKMGLRWEYTNIRLSANESIMSYDYINLFPSLSYSRRISRPNFWWISNITNQINQYSQFRGNSDLQPESSIRIGRFNLCKFSLSKRHIE